MAALPLLAGDVGGTNTRLALLSPDGKKVVRQDVLKSREHPSLESAMRAFLGKERVRAACLGIAGPVLDGKCNATNLPWVIDERVLERKLHIERVMLLNDLVAAAYGAAVAPRTKLAKLWGERLPQSKGGNLAIIAVGTGLGEAGLVWDGEKHIPMATEGGHADFAPRTDVEMRLLTFMQKRLQKRVSYERVLSGPGLGHVYDFFAEGEGVRETAANAKKLAAAPDRNAAVTELALAGTSKPASKALSLFIGLYGAETGNFALRTLPTAGLFVAGGIAVKLLRELQKGAFTRAYLDKGRLEPIVRSIPVAVVLDGDVGLKGSARMAATLVARG